jgi:drug/metabolite transporter (DMT)-like permease
MSRWETVLSRPAVGVPTLAALVVAVFAITLSGPLIAYAAAPGLAIACWRNIFAAGALVPFAATTRRGELARLAAPAGRPVAFVSLLAGLALAVHFATWVPAVKLTGIAAATALVATQPVWQGLIALGQGRRLPTVVWVGIGLAVGGAILATGADIGFSARAFAGDLLALAGGIAGAVYTAYGERARTATSTTTYTAVCYTACALLLVGVCLVARVPLGGYAATTWLAILAMAAGPHLLGHSMFNYALKRVSATTVAVLLLLEVPGAALVGWLWLGQTPRLNQVPGLALLVVGVAVVVIGAARTPTAPRLAPAEEL